MADDKTRAANVFENGRSPYAVTITVSGHKIDGDEPADAGGKNTGPSPYDTLLAALGECTAMTVRWYAIQKDWPLQRVTVDLTHRKDNKTDIFTKKVTLHGPLTAEQHKKLIEVAGKCPVQRTLEGTPVIQTED